MQEKLQKSIERVVRWVENHDYEAYDPGDGDLSYLRYVTFNKHPLKRLLTAVVLRTPFHIRPLIGIAPHRSTKGTGYMAWGYVKMFAATGNDIYRQRAEACFDWLLENRSPGYSQYCWGNHFDFSTRGGTMKRFTPTIVWSGLIGHAFLEGYEVLGKPCYLEVATSIARWVATLPREQTENGLCLSYVPNRQSSIHNSNMIGAALLARVAALIHDDALLALSQQSMLYSCSRQNPDGAWYYGEDSKYHWIDNFHTGYNLDCLKRYKVATGDCTFDGQLRLGFQYFKKSFFLPDGRPKYFHDRLQPIDIQCAAQAIDTLAFFADEDPDALRLAEKTAVWTIDHMQDPDGHFYYRDLGWKTVKTPMLHWGQGTTFKALAHLLVKLISQKTA